jgi:hypothetical protein
MDPKSATHHAPQLPSTARPVDEFRVLVHVLTLLFFCHRYSQGSAEVESEDVIGDERRRIPIPVVFDPGIEPAGARRRERRESLYVEAPAFGMTTARVP